MIYLDYQATTPLAPEAFAAMEPWLKDSFANPSSPHSAGRKAAAAVEVAREQVAALCPLGGRVVFTSGATEALNMAIKGVNGPVATIATEHAAVRDCVEQVRLAGHETYIWPVDRDGLVTRPNIASGTALVAAMMVNNEIGVRQDIAALADAAHEAGALMLCDAVQGYGRYDIPDNCDFAAISAHKIYGPKGIGALWIRDGVTLDKLMHGGGQESGERSGTVSPALCAGFGAAAALMAERREEDAAHVEALWEAALDCFSDWTLNGSAEHRYHGNFNIRRDGVDVSQLVSQCRDIAFSAGSACASGSGKPSHVLAALGLTETQAKSSIRLGFGRQTTISEIQQAAETFNQAVENML